MLVSYTDTPTAKTAGVVSLHVHGSIAPYSTALWDSACKLSGTGPVHPWAYLGHTHQYGRLVTAWRVRPSLQGDYINATWDLVGGNNPALPQSFLMVDKNIVINPGDKKTKTLSAWVG